jgi:hypothetical protein
MPAAFVREERPTKSRRPTRSTSPPFERRRLRRGERRAIAGQRRGNRRHLAAPRRSARPRHERDLVEHDGDVLDEAAVRVRRIGRKLDDLEAQRAQQIRVGRVLRPGAPDVDRLARAEGELAARERGRDAPHQLRCRPSRRARPLPRYSSARPS